MRNQQKVKLEQSKQVFLHLNPAFTKGIFRSIPLFVILM